MWRHRLAEHYRAVLGSEFVVRVSAGCAEKIGSGDLVGIAAGGEGG